MHHYRINVEGTYSELLERGILEPIYFELHDEIDKNSSPVILRDHGKLVYIAPTRKHALRFGIRQLEREEAFRKNIVLF